MTDYGHPITFGLSLDPDVDRLDETGRLAKAAALPSVLAGGRLVLGLGGGAFADGIAGLGDGRETIACTEESLHVMRAALAGGTVRSHSAQHAIEGHAAEVVPAVRERVDQIRGRR